MFASAVSGSQNFRLNPVGEVGQYIERQWEGLNGRLLSLGWIVGRDPLVPASLEHVNLGKTFFYELPCHTGTGSFIRSVSVKYEFFVFGILVGPGFHTFRILPHRTLDFFLTGPPAITTTNV